MGHVVAWSACLLLTAFALAGLTAVLTLRARHLDRWLAPYVFESSRRSSPSRGSPVHVLLCVADHFEPHNGGADERRATKRVRTWAHEYPNLSAEFQDSDGRPPQHSFFYPVEQYNREHVEMLAALCARGFGEFEVHLHHDHDTSDHLRETLETYTRILAQRHALLAREKKTGRIRYGFIHGNWALDNSRPDGRWCGVNNELDVLRQTGCYADFTLPSAPSPTQTRQINSIYYACDDPLKPKSHDVGIRAGTGPVPAEALMLIQGPLLLDWHRRKWGGLPGIENGCLQHTQPPSAHRLDLWLRARIQVPARPDWFFIKLYTHGAPEENQRVLLHEPMREFHRLLARRAAADPRFFFHYVTAREMYNLARAAEAGWTGTVEGARDYELVAAGSSKVVGRSVAVSGVPTG